MKQVKAEIIAIGTELLLGQIANTNAQWISQQLALYGVDVYYHGVVGDNLDRVEATFKQAATRSDIIIISGGLGPTDDDMTREAFQSISQMEMIEHTPSMNKIETYFQKQQTKMTPNNRKQARVFRGSHVIENTVGMAPGMIVTFQNKTWIFLPGVPKEMKQMVKDDIIPYLQQSVGEEMLIESTVLKFIGIGEAMLEHELRDMIKAQKNPTIAPLAQDDGVVIRLTAKESSKEKANHLLDQTKNEILSKVGDYFYGSDSETIEKKIVSMLKEQNKQIAIAESLTGGKFTEKLTSVSGVSQVCLGGIVCYDAKVKTEILGVSTDTIRSKGTVSYECASEMASNVMKLLNANIGISFTGVAGPNGIEGQPVGTVYIGVCDDSGQQKTEKFIFQGNRESVRRRAVLKGFEMLLHFLNY